MIFCSNAFPLPFGKEDLLMGHFKSSRAFIFIFSSPVAWIYTSSSKMNNLKDVCSNPSASICSYYLHKVSGIKETSVELFHQTLLLFFPLYCGCHSNCSMVNMSQPWYSHLQHFRWKNPLFRTKLNFTQQDWLVDLILRLSSPSHLSVFCKCRFS